MLKLKQAATVQGYKDFGPPEHLQYKGLVLEDHSDILQLQLGLASGALGPAPGLQMLVQVVKKDVWHL